MGSIHDQCKQLIRAIGRLDFVFTSLPEDELGIPSLRDGEPTQLSVHISDGKLVLSGQGLLCKFGQVFLF